MSKPSDSWQRVLNHVQLQHQLQQRQLAGIDAELNRLLQQRDELLARSGETDTTFPMAASSALRRLDRVLRELQKTAHSRQATATQLRIVEARRQVVEERKREAVGWEDRLAEGRSLEDMTALRLIADPSSPAQENT
jgi:hypothetical protein